MIPCYKKKSWFSRTARYNHWHFSAKVLTSMANNKLCSWWLQPYNTSSVSFLPLLFICKEEKTHIQVQKQFCTIDNLELLFLKLKLWLKFPMPLFFFPWVYGRFINSTLLLKANTPEKKTTYNPVILYPESEHVLTHLLYILLYITQWIYI